MSENKHTPEPWRTDAECGFPQDIHDSKGNLFLRCGSDFDNEIYGEANARRIVACVNACAGIPDEQLCGQEPGCLLAAMTEQEQEIMTITNQRDELLAALRHFATWARGQHRAQSKGWHATFDMMMLRDEIDFAEAAIASVNELK